jgi:hypothetical protein
MDTDKLREVKQKERRKRREIKKERA